ncbi:sensor histidine kinase [Taibaiella soli]|uniref:Signal transduction histidine kinase internal region domain-containing protein n=1 Tax=Taibaiella soli TaxID=1649169 RepID=A0A2W2AGN3_9BACT|nr:sensor histidine kinase [Taibaiella soli]PZF74421.1 hypothetical protein DN068_02250 [Taibaiella soli]
MQQRPFESLRQLPNKSLNEHVSELPGRKRRQSESESALLRSQITPHFLYNTLNFFYAKSLRLSDELADGIMKLSEIMHYSLRKHDAEGLAILNEELDHIHNVLDLARFRFSDKLYLETDFDIFDNNLKTIPFLFITLVENILKHGDLSDGNYPAKVSIKQSDDNTICYASTNKKRRSIAEKTTSVGLAYVASQLKDTFGNNGYRMTVVEDEQQYFITVSLPVVKR